MTGRTAASEAAVAAGESPVVLATVTLPDGRVLRHATRALSVETGRALDGPYSYHPTLAGVDDFAEEIDPWALSGAGSLVQARVEVTTTLDLAALQADWHAVTAATVEVAALWEGERWEEREVLLRAGVQSVEFGRVGEPTVFAVESAAPSTSAVVGDDTRDVGALSDGQVDTSGDDVTDLSGSRFQVVLGAPRSVPGYKIGTGGGIQNRVVLCGHPLPDLSAVDVYDDGALAATVTPANVLTGTGAPWAQVSHLTEFTASAGALTWDAQAGGIARADDRSRPVLTAGDVLSYLLDASGVDVDWARCRRAIDLLASWPVGFYLDEQAPALDVVREYLLPWLPLVEMASAAGVWYAYVDPWEGPPEFDLVLGQSVAGHDGPMVSSDVDQVRNDFTMRYHRDEFLGEFTESARVHADNDALCSLSRQLHGARADDALDCPVFWDAVTARRSLRTRAARVALPRRRLRYLLAPGAYPVYAGATASVTDGVYGIVGARGIVVSRQVLGPPVVVVDLVDRTPAGRW